MRLRRRAIAALLICPSIALAAPKPGMLAVLEFRNKLERREVDAGYLSDRVRSAVLAQVPSMKVMTRENLLVLIEATGRKMEDCEGECEVDTGRRIGADYVVSGDVLRFGTSIKVNLRLHETAGGSLLAGVVASGRTADELDANIGAAVVDLMKPFAPSSVAEAAIMEATGRGFIPPPSLAAGRDVARELLVLRDAALKADEPGAPRPDAVAVAWQKLADAPAPNPWRIDARNRAEYWRAYAKRFSKLEQAMAMTELSPANKQKMIDDFSVDFGNGVVEPLIGAVQPRSARPEICSALSSKLKERRIAVRTVGPMGRDAIADVEVDGRIVGKSPGEIAAPPCAESVSFVVPGATAKTLPLTPQTAEIAALLPDRSWSVGFLAAMTYDLGGTTGSGAIAGTDAAAYGPDAALFLLGEYVQARAGFRLGSTRNISSCAQQPCSQNMDLNVLLAAGGLYWLGNESPVPSAWRAGIGARIESGFEFGEMQTPAGPPTSGVLKWSGVPVVPTVSLFVAWKRAFFVEPSIGRGVAFMGSCSVRASSGGTTTTADCGVLNRTRLALSFGYGF